ncbi:hypothetical protein GH714_032844 [Hevea brasiliensis]|uniref:Uncharacterized protein n=1 Tax=Hevea brasiliensis TaxID=3981 RepID=A0A6A6LW65_HEVBR|nr:hypothetical protein GH714_032844 [Hevea brasiliensis]
MEQRSSPHYQPRYTRNDEIEVSAILLKLPSLIVESELAFNYHYPGVPKGGDLPMRFSASFIYHQHRSVVFMGWMIFWPLSLTREDHFKVQASSSSPATPLAFPPSESDEKPKRLKGTASAKKLSLGSIRREKPQWEMKASKNSLNFKLKRRQPIVKASSTVVGYEDHHHHHRPSIMDTTANKAEIAESYQYSNGQNQSLASRTGSTISEDVGPRGVPDLNVSSWESLRMDFANTAMKNDSIQGNGSSG